LLNSERREARKVIDHLRQISAPDTAQPADLAHLSRRGPRWTAVPITCRGRWRSPAMGNERSPAWVASVILV